MKKKAPKSEYEKRIDRRGIALNAVALVLAFGFWILGLCAGDRIPEEAAAWMFIVGVLLPVLWLPVSLLLSKLYCKRQEAVTVAEWQRMLLEGRAQAEESSVVGLRAVQRLRRCSDVLAVVLVLCGMAVGFGTGALYGNSNLVRLYGAFCWILCGLTQIRFPAPKEIFTEDRTYISERDYPQLYALARQAMEAVGCEGKLAISLQGDFNGGIAHVGDTYSVQLGAMLVELLNREELYTVLLHEFGHMRAELQGHDRERKYNNFISNGKNPHWLGFFAEWLYRFTDTLYLFAYFRYEYACSVLYETAADRAMAEYGDARYAASALLKSKYYELYEWECGVEDTTPFYAAPEAPTHVIADQVKPFLGALAVREGAWRTFVDREIISRSASHPTLKMRLETLGVTDWGIMDAHESEDYRAECTKAREYVEALVYENGAESYKIERVEEYLKPAARVAEWEEAGKPLDPVGYADVVDDLRAMGRNREAEAVCDSAIEVLDPAAAAYAYFMRGLNRLHRYDPAGMDDLYIAMSHNHNAIDRGLDAIGHFCCITGRQEELDTYRQRAVQIGQHQKDVYSEVSILRKNDRLAAECLPDALMAGLRDTIAAADDGSIEAVYLVRKHITEDFFSSVVVVRFGDAPTEQRGEILHKVFRYLDAADWQFSLFDYEDVKKVKVERIPDSCIYQKEKTNV